MAVSSNTQLASAGASNNSRRGILTPSSSNDTASHASAAGSNNTAGTASNPPGEPSDQLLEYLAQSPTEDGPPYGRFVDQPHTGADPHGRIAFHMALAQRANDRFDEAFQPTARS
ncbi:hypothetical protein C8A00DRAFT_34087 [Chaetomidium leptoderma]|uniref:Uncharacterized protein n=1 Tax=Chaetomidium leptoderma TaxID=669021 RepID=A0AAN6VKG8_9PEZI|nr:hypothetical protein C8A00DRAFT_34087 [Chaetomidium leptoderma]